MLGLRISPLFSTGQLMFMLALGAVFDVDLRTTDELALVLVVSPDL
jgi:hypothetical protein